MFGLSLGMGKQNRKKAIEFAKDVVDNLQSVIITNPQKGDYLDQDKNGVWVNFPKPEVDIFKLMKTNEELTAENSRLLVELEGQTQDKEVAELNYNICHDKLEGYMYLCEVYSSENRLIKSTRLYRLFKWLGVW